MFRPDGLPVFFDDVTGPPYPPYDRKQGNWGIDQFGLFVAQCMWMHQGRFKLLQEGGDIIQMPFLVLPPSPGQKMINHRTGTVYEVVQVLQNYREVFYSEPQIADVPESIVLRNRVPASGLLPDELTGATVQLKAATWDLDPSKKDFLSVESSGRVSIRQAYGETRDYNGSGYELRWRVESYRPGSGKELGGRPRGIKPGPRPVSVDAGGDPTTLPSERAQTFDSVVAFQQFAPNAAELNVLTNWFEMFMSRYTPVLERIGYTRILFDRREEREDGNLNKPGTGAVRTTRYGVRTERLWPGRLPILRSVDVVQKQQTEE